MTQIKENTVDDYIKGMQKHVSKIKTLSSEQSRDILIRTGVLNKNGSPKKNICTGGFYGK